MSFNKKKNVCSAQSYNIENNDQISQICVLNALYISESLWNNKLCHKKSTTMSPCSFIRSPVLGPGASELWKIEYDCKTGKV